MVVGIGGGEVHMEGRYCRGLGRSGLRQKNMIIDNTRSDPRASRMYNILLLGIFSPFEIHLASFLAGWTARASCFCVSEIRNLLLFACSQSVALLTVLKRWGTR